MIRPITELLGMLPPAPAPKKARKEANKVPKEVETPSEEPATPSPKKTAEKAVTPSPVAKATPRSTGGRGNGGKGGRGRGNGGKVSPGAASDVAAAVVSVTAQVAKESVEAAAQAKTAATDFRSRAAARARGGVLNETAKRAAAAVAAVKRDVAPAGGQGGKAPEAPKAQAPQASGVEAAPEGGKVKAPEGGKPEASDGKAPEATVKQENPDASAVANDADSAAEKGRFDGKKWARYQRSLQPSGDRAARTVKCPPAIAARIRSANPKEAKEWFQLYADCDTDWATVEMTIKTLERDLRSDVSEMEWYTKEDLMEKHHGNVKVVDGIIKTKSRDETLWRPHPDAPEVEEANQFLCLRFERRRKEHEEATEKGLSMNTQLGNQASKSVLGLFPSGVSAGSLFTQASADGTSASSDDAAKKAKEREAKRAADIAARRANKDKPLSKVEKAATIAGTEIGKIAGWINEIDNSKVNADTKKLFKTKFNKHSKQMKEFKAECVACSDEALAIQLVDKQPPMQQAIKTDISAWKKIVKALGFGPK